MNSILYPSDHSPDSWAWTLAREALMRATGENAMRMYVACRKLKGGALNGVGIVYEALDVLRAEGYAVRCEGGGYDGRTARSVARNAVTITQEGGVA